MLEAFKIIEAVNKFHWNFVAQIPNNTFYVYKTFRVSCAVRLTGWIV